VEWIRAQLGLSKALALYLGDDLTDEDAFRSVADGIAVKVGNPSNTCAPFSLESPHAVQGFLQWLAELVF
jgi:trehalose 6-phosphate phosphatase